MKIILKKLSAFILSFLLIFTGSFSISNANNNLAKMDVESLRKKISNKTIYRLAGEPTLYDKETGVEFNPSTGKIINLNKFHKLPGEPYYVRKPEKGNKTKYKEFKPSDYNNLKYTATVTSYKKTNNKEGWTVSLGIKVQAKNKRSLYKEYSLRISYVKSEEAFYVSGAITKTKIKAAGKKQKRLVTLGFTPKNKFGIEKESRTAGLSAGLFGISANSDGTITLSAASNAGGAVTVGKSKTKEVFCIPIK